MKIEATDITQLAGTTRERPRVLMFTEGTFPYTVGGVSTWCDALISGLPDFDWYILPLVANGFIRPSLYDLPDYAQLCGSIDVWSDMANPMRFRRSPKGNPELIAALTRGLLAWNSDVDELVATFRECHDNPGDAVDAFQAESGWDAFVTELQNVLATDPQAAGVPPVFDVHNAVELYRSIYWLARAAMAPTPEVDVLHVTCAGWSAVPALVHQSIHGTPLLVTEHGVYVRESYLRASLSTDSAPKRFAYTRIARGLSRAVFAKADVLTPVTEVNGEWETSLGVPREKIIPIYNGVESAEEIVPLPRTATVVTVGRLNVLKDVKTMLRVAEQVLRLVPEATFLHYGPVPRGGEAYAESCYALHEELQLGDRFKFMGPTREPQKVLHDADVFLMTSISEGLPIALLEAMAEGRPSVATSVGGAPETVKGCGVLAAPGDIHTLAMGVVTLLRNYDLAERLGVRARDRLRRHFSEDVFLYRYRDLLTQLATNMDNQGNRIAS